MNKLIALWMGERDGDKPWNLNYDSPDHFARLTKRLFENTLLYERFEYYAGTAWANSGTHQYMIQWLFQSDDQLRYTRFITLFTEFLRLPEVVERFGWVECQYKKEWPRTKPDGKSTFFCELECNKKDIPSWGEVFCVQVEEVAIEILQDYFDHSITTTEAARQIYRIMEVGPW